MACVLLDYKAKVIALADAHPKWSLSTLKKRGAGRLKSKKYLARWRKDVESGGTKYDKLHKIDTEVFELFKKARASGQQVKFINLPVTSFNNNYVYGDVTFYIHLNNFIFR